MNLSTYMANIRDMKAKPNTGRRGQNRQRAHCFGAGAPPPAAETIGGFSAIGREPGRGDSRQMDSLPRITQAFHERTDIPAHPIVFSDGFVQIVNFGRFLQNSLNPHVRKYLDVALFADFTVENGDLHWHGYELCFPIADLYENRI